MTMTLRTIAALTLALALLPLGASAVASTKARETTASEDDHVRTLLSGYEQVPDRESWLAMKGGVVDSLVRLSGDRRQAPAVSARACEVLGWFEPARAVPALKAALANRALASAVRAGAVTGLVRAQSQKEALATLGTTLNDAEPLVRYRTAIELKRLGWPGGKALLRKRLTVEKDGSVRRVIEAALQSGGK